MATAELYFATNRRHQGRDRWKPSGYGIEPSRDGTENLRFGRVSLSYDAEQTNRLLQRDCGFGIGDGGELASYFVRQKRRATIEAFPENLPKDENESALPEDALGSSRAFSDLRAKINAGCRLLVFIHGFNVSWWEAVGSALSLQCMLNRHRGSESPATPIQVILFTWPSDGRAIPFWSYFSDRGDASGSGYAFGRGLLKLRDYLIRTRRADRRRGVPPCRGSIHLLCHSMGNYVLQCALERTAEFTPGGRAPRIFDHIFLCAPDVADDVFEPEQPMRSLPQFAWNITVYHNRGDVTMPVSDYTKGNSDRLGWAGPNRPADLDSRVHQVDCSDIVSGVVEHSYYHCGRVNDDIRRSMDGLAPEDDTRDREPVRHGWPNVWRLV